MLSTLIFAALCLGIVAGSFVLWACFLRIGLSWAKVPDVTTGGVILATAAVFLIRLPFSLLFAWVLLSTSDVPSNLATFLELATAVIVPCLVIIAIFKAGVLRAFQAWLPTLLASVATAAFALIVLRPFLFGAFIIPTNSMAPTLVGTHRQGVCPQCGQPSYCSPVDEPYALSDPPWMICDNFHVNRAVNVDPRVHSGERIMAAKFLTPKRWDLVVFQLPEDPTQLYVMRLVGLPGEQVHIEDGSAWVDGKRLVPPESIRGIEYLAQPPDWYGPELWGSQELPAQLGDDEYFVLGDFSALSHDSRLWEGGAPGHPPFAVPQSHVEGVVTHTYWPPGRWRIHR